MLTLQSLGAVPIATMTQTSDAKRHLIRQPRHHQSESSSSPSPTKETRSPSRCAPPQQQSHHPSPTIAVIKIRTLIPKMPSSSPSPIVHNADHSKRKEVNLKTQRRGLSYSKIHFTSLQFNLADIDGIISWHWWNYTQLQQSDMNDFLQSIKLAKNQKKNA